jgi:hypothetical protein
VLCKKGTHLDGSRRHAINLNQVPNGSEENCHAAQTDAWLPRRHQLLIQLAALNLETCQADWLNRITARVKTKRVVPTMENSLMPSAFANRGWRALTQFGDTKTSGVTCSFWPSKPLIKFVKSL